MCYGQTAVNALYAEELQHSGLWADYTDSMSTVDAPAPRPSVPQHDPAPAKPHHRPNPLRVVPKDERGYCSVCGANYFEYLDCKQGDCNWVVPL